MVLQGEAALTQVVLDPEAQYDVHVVLLQL
jgi:hypothetical protein